MKHKFVIAIITTGIFLFGAAAVCADDTNTTVMTQPATGTTSDENNVLLSSESSDENGQTSGSVSAPIIQEDLGENQEQETTSSEQTTRETWINENGSRYYYDKTGNKVKGISKIGDTIYYFDPGTGALIQEAGWKDWNGKKYYTNSQGIAFAGMFISFGIPRYYMGSDGAVMTGLFTAADGRRYNADETGQVIDKAQWIEKDGKKYYSNGQGELYRNQFISFGTPRYYMGSDGAVMTGLFTVADGRRYNADETGQVINKAQWIEQEGKKYYSNGQGELYRNQFISFGTPRYYMGSDGAVMTGLFTAADGHRYNADETGQIIDKAQWIEKDGRKYYSNGQGELYRNQFISFGTPRYYMGSDGAVMTGLFTAADGRRYNADETGQIIDKSQWIEKDGRKYYSNGQGELYRNQFISFGTPRYYMGSDGAVMTGLFTAADGRRYNADETGQIVNKAQWIEKDGRKYFSDSQGELYMNCIISFGNDHYYLGNDGALVTGSFYYDGSRYTTNDKGVINEPIVHTWMSNMNSLARSMWSSTNYKILVDRHTNVLGVYQLSGGSWNPIAFWSCSTGASQTPTPSGIFQTGLKGYSFGHGYTCYYWTGFIGSQYLFHSTLYSQGTFNSIDSRLGLNISHGCVRLAIESAKWIYDNIPTGTAVRIY
ncbi:L,D-transpeptidase family protein [Mobilibacterium timonense]|uniref:L,D-transpeptidase family protein n=1 Tax=Mobilibacterium timonense TaxID=1871012 RepID=UPI0009876D6F|nr:L,D-transpeptidase family protein [Mobilibacterium timonense]